MAAAHTIGVGIVGAGSMGRAYAECLRRFTRGAKLIAITGGSRTGELAEEYEVERATSAEELVARREISAVIIASPETAHCEQTLLAASHGKHVLVEKPMAPNLAQCDAMIAACARANVVLMVVKHWRFRGVHVRARELLALSAPGAIQSIANRTHATLTSSIELVKRKPFYCDPNGGGLLMGWAVHNLDCVSWMVGKKPRAIRSLESARSHELVGPTHLATEIKFDDDVIARVTVSIDLAEVAPSDIFRTTVETERGSLDLDGYGKLQVRRDGQWSTSWTQPKFDPRNATDPLRLEAYAAMVQAFIDSVRTGAPPPVTGKDGRNAVALFLAAMEADRTGGVLAL